MGGEGLGDQIAGLIAMSSGDSRLDTLIRLTCGRALSLPPLPVEVDLIDGSPQTDRVVAAFTEQFAVDVAGIGGNQRSRFIEAMSDNAFRVVVTMLIADFVPRVWAGCDALSFGRALRIRRCAERRAQGCAKPESVDG